MKKQMGKKKLAILLAASGLALLSGCGSNPQNNVGVIPGGTIGGVVGGGCLPLSSTQIPFTVNGGTLTNNYILKAGQLPADNFAFQPAPEVVGAVMVGGTAYNQAGYGYGTTLAGQSRYNGTMIQVNVSQATTNPYGTYYPQTGSIPVQMTGMIQLSPVLTQYLSMMASNNYYNMSGFPYTQLPGYSYGSNVPGTMYPYVQNPQMMANQGCISGVAFRLERLAGTSNLGLGAVWLYLSGQARGVSLAF